MLECLERREFFSAVVSPTSSLNLTAGPSVSVAALSTTATVVDTSAQWTVYGQGVTFTAFVSGGGTGEVSFFDGTTLLGTGPLQANGQAKFWTPSLAPGSHSISATYGGDATHAASTSAPLLQSVSTAHTTVKVGSSAGVIQNPILRPDHVVVVILENGASNAVGDTATMPYLNDVAASGLVYNNSHGLNGSQQIFGQMNYLALYSGSTQGITDDFEGYTFGAPNLAQSLHDGGTGLSFTGYAESLPAAGDMATRFAPDAPGSVYTDAYARRYNPMAQFTNVGAGKTNADVNKPFSAFPTDYAGLSTVSYVIPNRLHNTHGSNEAPPFANDPAEYTRLRQDADLWLRQNIDGYLQWARANNSLLIITTEDADRTRNYAGGGTTIVAGDPDLFVSGVNGSYVTAYSVLRTIEDMYGLSPIGDTVPADRFDTDVLGRLSPAGPAANTLVTGQSVSYTATVSPIAPATGTPGGTIQFLVDGSNFGGPVVLTGGSASISLGGLDAGGHTISAVYGGSPFYDGNRANLTQQVNPSGTSVGLTSSAPSTGAGSAVTFTATVSAAPGSGAPSGLVTFRDGATVLGTATLDAAGRATLTTSALSAGAHSITGVYGGDANHAGSTSPALSQVVNVNGTALSLTTSAPAAKAGEAITFTAKVTTASAGAPAPTGTVTFREGTVTLGTATLNEAGEATFTTTALGVGTHFITATYAGDATSAAATSPTLTQAVAANASTTALASSAPSATAGHSVVFTATVTGAAPGGLKPGGTVAFFDGSTQIGTAALDAAGKAVFTTSSLTVGTHSIRALYAGNAVFAGSASPTITQTIVAVPTPTGPANDKFADRIRLTGSTATASGSNVRATRETGEPKHGSNGGGKSVWWSWTAPSSGFVTVDTLGSNFKTALGVYTGTLVVNLKKVSGVSGTVSNTAAFGFVAKAGTTYHIAVDGAGGATGAVDLRVKTWGSRDIPSSGWKSVLNKGDDDRDDDDDKKKGKKKNKSDD